MTTAAEKLQAALTAMPPALRHGGVAPREYADALGGMALAVRDALDELAKGFTPPQPNQWCKIVCRKDGEPVLVTRDWDSDEEVEVVRLELRKKFSMTISLHFDGADDTAKADRAFAAITGDNVDDVLKTRGVDSIMSKLGND